MYSSGDLVEVQFSGGCKLDEPMDIAAVLACC